MKEEVYPVFEKEVNLQQGELKPWSCGDSLNLHSKGVLPKEFYPE